MVIPVEFSAASEYRTRAFLFPFKTDDSLQGGRLMEALMRLKEIFNLVSDLAGTTHLVLFPPQRPLGNASNL
jgi:hypothetical protein